MPASDTGARLAQDFARFGREWPRDWPAHVRDAYRIDLGTQYLGVPLPHPIGKASGQLSLKPEQLEADAEAGLAFVVLKTVIAEDAEGAQAMAAWAIHETRMTVEPIRAADGREGWTVTWKGRGWDRSLDDYLALVRAGRDLARGGGPLAVPSVKYHLPRLGEPFREGEYRYTTRRLAEAWGAGPLLLEKDFSPTLAGDPLADERAQILRWLREVPAQARAAVPDVRLALKLMNARFDDAFQRAMLEAATGADAVTVFNRLWDAGRGVAYGGWDLSDRNLRVLERGPAPAAWPHGMSGTGNVCTGRVLLDYALRGCATVQLHTFFQLPLRAYPAEAGSRAARALHALVFHPEHGLLAGLLELERRGGVARHDGELRFRDVVGAGRGRPETEA
ncbi:MAG TPA: hypothetical protein VFS40_05950 [Gemmatimonadales bacterium]|nr:hypothetical protein [Gemmatimonadales bacterium]